MPTPNAWAFFLLVISLVKCVVPILVCLACVAFVDPAVADTTDFLVNDDGGTAEQSTPRIAVAGDGGFVIVWADKRSGQNDIYLQPFEVDGTPVGTNRLVNTDTNSAWQSDPAIGTDYDGLNSVVWRDYRTGSYPFDANVFFQRYDSSLTPTGDNLRLTTELPEALKEAPDIALSPWGSGVIVWADYRSGQWDVYGQLMAADGSLIGSNFKVNSDPGSAQQHAPRVAYAAEGWIVVVWYDNRNGHDDIYAQRFDSLGNPLGGNVLVNSDGTTTRQAFPVVAADAAGQFTVAWVDWRNGVYPGNPDIYAKRLDTSMVPLTADLRINGDVGTTAQWEPSIASDRLGNVAIIWSDSSQGSFDIMGQLIDVDGVLQDFNFQANEFTDSAQLRPDVALDGRYRFVTWVDKRNGNFDIYASITEYNNPTLTVLPAQLAFSYQRGAAAPGAQSVVVDHLGLGAIAFEAASSAVWLNASPGSGQSVDTLTVTIDTTGLTAGSHFGTLFIVDSVTRDSSVSVSVRVDVTPAASTDTLAIGTTQTAPLAQGVVFVDAFLNADIERLLLPIGYDSTLVTIDSIVLTTSLPTGMTFGYDIDSVDQAARLWLFNDDPDSSLAAGYHPLAEIYYTTGSSLGTNPLNAIAYDTNLVHVVRAGGQRRTPAVIAGQITVDDQTPVGDDLPGGLPQKLVLDPNYPNPFNATTTIEFSLPAAAPVTLEVFNILGQRVAILVDELRPVGRYIEVWDGRVGDGEPSTGIYFYRLRAGEQEQIRKMLLLK